MLIPSSTKLHDFSQRREERQTLKSNKNRNENCLFLEPLSEFLTSLAWSRARL